MRYILLPFLTVILLANYNNAQITDYNLEKLNNVNVQIMDNGLLSRRVSQKLETEIKSKLMSASIKILSEEKTEGLAKYIKEEDKKDKKLFGNFVIHKDKSWRYNDSDKYEYTKKNLSIWKFLE